jgi:hypothetical protein
MLYICIEQKETIMEYLLEALRQLTLKEQEGTLTHQEELFYVYCVNTLNEANIVIPFGIQM